MNITSACLTMLSLLIVSPGVVAAADQPPGRATFDIIAVDPAADATLAAGDRLYLHVSYNSAVPVRFAAEAWYRETLQKDAFASSTPPYDAGRGEAIAWIGFPRPTRIDEIRVTAYDMGWQELGTRFIEAATAWERRESNQPREPAAWVNPLLKQHRHMFDNTFDPQPEKPAPLFDAFFLLSFMAMPLYLLMQLQMLIRYRGSWQGYAAAPLLPMVPLGLYSAFGLGLSSEQWIIFLFRYMTIALIYLAILWVVKWRCEQAGTGTVRQEPPTGRAA